MGYVMAQVLTEKLHEAEQLLEEVRSWTEEEIEALPQFYRERAKEYRRMLTQPGEE